MLSVVKAGYKKVKSMLLFQRVFYFKESWPFLTSRFILSIILEGKDKKTS